VGVLEGINKHLYEENEKFRRFITSLFMILVLMTSIGLPKTQAVNPAIPEEIK